MKKMVRSKKGFTLIELVIVVTVLAILAAIAIPVVGNVVDKANKSADAANVALYQGAMERYNLDNGAYPTGADAAATRTAAIDAITQYTNATAVEAPKQGGHFAYDSSNGKVSRVDAVPSGSIALDT